MLQPAPIQPLRIAIFDLDGTLADISHRLHFIQPPSGLHEENLKNACDWDAFYEACDEDKPIWPIIVMAQMLAREGAQIAIVTGRSEKVIDKTLEWLRQHAIPCQKLYMRPEGDFRPDHALKKEWYERAKLKPENVFMVFEDRARVVPMWRELGLTCLQVKDGDY